MPEKGYISIVYHIYSSVKRKSTWIVIIADSFVVFGGIWDVFNIDFYLAVG